MSKIALVTGVAGGIGLATAERFSSHGWKVVGIDSSPGDQTHIHRFVQMDITDDDAPSTIVDGITSQEGRLDVIVNNAALQICDPIEKVGQDQWDLVMKTNARAPYLLVREALLLLEKSGGAVVNVASIHAVATSKHICAYASSKGALVAMTRALAVELGTRGVRVNAVLPGAIDTKMLREGLARDHAGEGSIEDRMQTLAQRHVIGRVGSPVDVARAILYLSDTDTSGFITGQSLVVDGGAIARLSTE